MEPRGEPPPVETVTGTDLLAALADPENQTAWRDWVERYRPLVVSFAERSGVPPADAEDLAQESLLAFARAYRDGRYERSRGRLRSWLYGLARVHLLRWRARGRPAEASLDEEDRAGPDPFEPAWEEEWRVAVLRQCLAVIRREVEPATLRAFQAFVLEERPAREVAAELGLSENAVFGAKRRVLRRLRELEPLMEDVF